MSTRRIEASLLKQHRGWIGKEMRVTVPTAAEGRRDDSTGADLMFVTVIHHINDPEGFQAAEAKALEAGLPSHVALPIHAATDDHKLGICIWEGASVEAVREVVEGAVGPWANNEYFEMHVDGLTPQLGN